jgi:hypothetical protein
MTSCSVPDCSTTARSRGWCHKHYRRWYEHGDPNFVKVIQSAAGAPRAFFKEAIKYQGDECVFWPFACDRDGYATINRDRKKERVCRLICVKLYDNPPANQPFAAHSCGNGQFGCITPAHLRWASPQENSEDMVHHGNSQRGEKSMHHKLIEPEVLEIFRRSRAGENQQRLADEFGVHQASISRINLGKSWGWLTGANA